MSQYKKFEELPVWKEAARLYNRVLDLIEESEKLLSFAFRNQLERAALPVSNNIAEGFERFTTAELTAFLAIARGSAGEMRSMLAVIHDRPKLKQLAQHFSEIRRIAESCARQLTAWTVSLEASPVQGKRHLTPEAQQIRQARSMAEKYRTNFLMNLKPDHPMYNSPEARELRGEPPV